MCDTEHHCYNLGCGKKFKEASNHAKACTFHSGKPYFHDAYKVGACSPYPVPVVVTLIFGLTFRSWLVVSLFIVPPQP